MALLKKIGKKVVIPLAMLMTLGSNVYAENVKDRIGETIREIGCLERVIASFRELKKLPKNSLTSRNIETYLLEKFPLENNEYASIIIEDDTTTQYIDSFKLSIEQDKKQKEYFIDNFPVGLQKPKNPNGDYYKQPEKGRQNLLLRMNQKEINALNKSYLQRLKQINKRLK